MARTKKRVQVKAISKTDSFLTLVLPRTTISRIAEHCERNNLDKQDFLKKAIYDALPVHCEVTEEWTFPFGKYTGETAGTVKQLDPGYIDWCKKNIVGFHDKMNVDDVAAEADARNEYIRMERNDSRWWSYLKPHEIIKFASTGRTWAFNTQLRKHRFVGLWH